VPKDASSR